MLLNVLRRKIRTVLTAFYDPLVELSIGNQKIKVNLSHQLREIIRIYPDYNFNLARIVKYVSDEANDLSIIDIGANVGDTVAVIRNYSNAPILCIDGEIRYFKLLKANVSQYNNVSLCLSLVGQEDKEEMLTLKGSKGTAHLEAGNSKVKVRTLQTILDDYPNFRNSKILKTDTDGFDTWILRGSQTFLSNVKPIIFFEFDPHFIIKSQDDPFEFFDFLMGVGYKYFIFYTNVGDYLLSCSANDLAIIHDLIHYYSGRKVEMFLDICAFHAKDQQLFDKCCTKERLHFRKQRNY